jgi:hypothetical protein
MTKADKESSIKTVSIDQVIKNPNNPRNIKSDKFDKLVTSIKEFPEMLKLRPVVVNQDMIVLGGNMRLEACKKAGLKEVPIIRADQLTEEQQREFIIKDNVGFGDWDWDILANKWDNEQLNEWGLDVWQPEEEVDYSILDEEDVEDQLQDMADGVKKAIQIEFEPDHYDEAYELVKFWRDQDAYVGKMILDFLKSEKNKL